MESKYNSYGNLKHKTRTPLKNGDTVKYVNSRIVNRKKVKEVLYSYWLNGSAYFYDGDNNQIIVRTTEWVAKVGVGEWNRMVK